MSWHIQTSWRNQFNILWAGQALLMIVMAMSLPYWPLYISTLDHFSPTSLRYWSAAIYIAPFVTATFSSPLWGKWGDKYGYKPMVIRACFGLFITQTLILLSSSVELIFIFRLLQGVLAGFIVAAQTWALAISPESERGATIGKLQSATAIGTLMGPLVGGMMAAYIGYQAIFSFSSIACAIVTIVFLVMLQNVNHKNNGVNLNALPVQKNGIGFFHKTIFSILFVITIIQLARTMITPVFSLFVTEKLGGNEITIGVLYAATGLMVFITAPWWGKFFDFINNKEGYTQRIIVALLFISAVLQLLQAFAHTTISIFILRLLWGVCLGALLPILLRLLADNADVTHQGLFLGYGNSATKFGNLMGIIIGAAIEAHLGYTSTFILTALFYAASGIIILKQQDNSFE